MLPANVNILRINESTKFDPGGDAVRVDIISYMLGKDGPFTLEVLPANNTPAWIESQINAKAASIAALRGGGA